MLLSLTIVASLYTSGLFSQCSSAVIKVVKSLGTSLSNAQSAFDAHFEDASDNVATPLPASRLGQPIFENGSIRLYHWLDLTEKQTFPTLLKLRTPREKFRTESEDRVLSALQGVDNVPRIVRQISSDEIKSHEADDLQGWPGIIVERIDGQTLEEEGESKAKLPAHQRVTQILQDALELTKVVDAVHARDFFHFDIKPSNIIRATNGRLILPDVETAIHKKEFRQSSPRPSRRSARLDADATPDEEESHAKGTPFYTPPELIGSSEHPAKILNALSDPRYVDVYAIAMTVLDLIHQSNSKALNWPAKLWRWKARKLPYSVEFGIRLKNSILKGFSAGISPTFDSRLRDLLFKLTDPKTVPSSDWIRQELQELLKMLNPETPALR